MKALLFLVFIIIVGYVLWSKFEIKIPFINTPANSSEVNTKTIKEENTAKRYVIDCEYPEIRGFLFNGRIKNLVDKVIADFILNLPTKDQLVDLPADLNSSLFIRYNVAQANNKVVSIEFDISDMKISMAHPDNYSKVFNFDPVNNKEIVLSDIFKTNSDYLDSLSKLCRDDLYKKIKPGDDISKEMVDQGTLPDEKNFSKFTLSKDQLIIIFDPYTVAPYSAGTQKVIIPFSSINQYLDI